MSIESTQGTSSVQLPAAPRDPALVALLTKAREINARPEKKIPPGVFPQPPKDPYLIADLFGTDYAIADKARRKFLMGMHPDRTASLPFSAEERLDLEKAVTRISESWAPIAKSKLVPARGEVALADADAGFASNVIIVAASFAEGGLRAANQGVTAARELWRRKVDDGTVDAVKAQAKDLFVAGGSWLHNRWTEALKRSGSKDASSE